MGKRPYKHLAALLAATLLLPGCGPTKEQLLQYELVLAGTGALLGLAIWALGYRLGRRFCPWFVCSYCLKPQRTKVAEGLMAKCVVCQQSSSVNYLDRQTLREFVSRKDRRRAHGREILWALLLALLTFGMFSLPCVAGWILLEAFGVDLEPAFDNVVLYPLWFVSFNADYYWPYVGLASGFVFYSYDIAWYLARVLPNCLLNEACAVPACYVALLALLVLLWYSGLKRWRWGWVLPVALGAVNAVTAVVAYYARPLP